MISWGANSHGQLGLGFTSEMCEKPERVQSLPFETGQVVAISAGGGHTLVSTGDGDLYGSGWNNRGQLGLGHTDDVCRFTLAGRYDFKQITCGWDVAGGLTADGDVYLWGSNVWQQVTAEKDIKYLLTPTKFPLPAGTKASKISFGLRHTCVLTQDGTLLLFGKSKWLQKESLLECSLHAGMDVYNLQLSGKIMDVVSGENHLVVKLERKIICVGDNKFGQSPQGVNLNAHKRQVVKLDSGWSHSGYLTVDGEVYLWGRNNYGQLGVAVDANRNEPVLLLGIESKVTTFCLGSQHGMALAVDGLYTWGWNEHGNCGTGGVENVLVPTKVEGMKQADEIATGAGFCFVLRRKGWQV